MRFLTIITLLYFSTAAVAENEGNAKNLNADIRNNSSISILTYNAFLRAPSWIFFRDRQTWRTKYIPDGLRGYDVVVLQEAFSNRHRKAIIEALEDEYPYQSKILGVNEFFSYNGGVIILSRWPILSEAQTVFTPCDGSDCMVKKGVVYTKINKLGKNYHLFGLHLQAQVEYADARIAQFPEVRDFIERQNIPEDEPLLIAGDFNVNYYTKDEDGEFDALVRMLNVRFQDGQPEATYSSATNSIVEDQIRERVDYVLYSNAHLQPSSAINQVICIREGDRDLSDHHGVVGRFDFGQVE